ncbi:MAG: hypothetical protein AB1750_16775, partial [Chloroflexota bacterium]
MRVVTSSDSPYGSVLDEYFKGPTLEEKNRGLVLVSNGFIGYRKIRFEEGILRVYLIGYCKTEGGAYSIASPLTLAMKQFPGVSYVKIYDEYERTRDPLGKTDSAPDCVATAFTPTRTEPPAPTATRTPSLTPSPTFTKIPTPLPTVTPTRTPSFTPSPTFTKTSTPPPASTPTRTPSFTPSPTFTKTPTPPP